MTHASCVMLNVDWTPLGSLMLDVNLRTPGEYSTVLEYARSSEAQLVRVSWLCCILWAPMSHKSKNKFPKLYGRVPRPSCPCSFDLLNFVGSSEGRSRFSTAMKLNSTNMTVGLICVASVGRPALGLTPSFLISHTHHINISWYCAVSMYQLTVFCQ